MLLPHANMAITIHKNRTNTILLKLNMSTAPASISNSSKLLYSNSELEFSIHIMCRFKSII